MSRYALIAGLCLLTAHPVTGQSTIATSQSSAWGPNIGWLNSRPSSADGLRTLDAFCSGFLWGANVGWLHFGDGAPSDGIRYSNAGGDYGVNVTHDGALRGYAWGANIGWVCFEDSGNTRIDLATGILSGHAWGTNIGWISMAETRTTQLAIVDVDADGISDAWEKEHAAGNLMILGATSDKDHDGQTDLAEFIADTNPLDPTDLLKILVFRRDKDILDLVFTSKPSRFYQITASPGMTAGSWLDAGTGILVGNPGNTAVCLPATAAPSMFYRVASIRPLAAP